MSKRTYIIIHIIRIAMVVYMLFWGIGVYDSFPEKIGTDFDTAGKVVENGLKKEFIPMFAFIIAAFIPMLATQVEDEEQKRKERRKALILSIAHSIFMCLIFLWRVNLINKNLIQ